MSTRQSSRTRGKRNNPEPLPAATPPPPKKKKTNAEACRDYKLKLKTDPTKCEAYNEKARLYSQKHRQDVTPEMKAKQNEQAKQRMRAKRARDRAQEVPAKCTRRTDEEQRAKWREEKKKQRDTLNANPRKKAWVKRKRRQEYQQMKLKELKQAKETNQKPQCLTVTESSTSSSPHTPAARRKALSRARASLPDSPNKYFQVVQDLKNKASPRKRSLFKSAESTTLEGKIGQQVLRKLTFLKRHRSKYQSTARWSLLSVCGGSLSARARCLSLGITRRTAKKMVSSSSTQLDSCAVKSKKKLEKEVKDFYSSSATLLPQKKLVSKKTGMASAVLCKPLADLHKEFKESTGNKVSYSHFAKCRPAYIRPARQNSLRQCLCEYCENVSLKIRAVNCIAAKLNNNCRVRHPYHAVDLVTCGREGGRWNVDCCENRCGVCSPDQLMDHLRPLLPHQGPVTWSRWESRATIVKGKTVTRKVLAAKHGAMVNLAEELTSEVVFLAGHLYRADWQYRQFDVTRKMTPFPRGTAMMIMDFAENFTCSFQDEVQAAHWHHEQVTVHPTVTYYACQLCPETVTESLVFVSDDRIHDFHAVFRFTQLAVDHLRTARGLEINNIIQWTDGCASQYKSKGPFADVSCAISDFGCTFERNFFGSRHGKGPSDGESAVVKSAVTRAVCSGQAIVANAKSLFDFCNNSNLNKQPGDNACKHSLRSFFYVDSASIIRNRDRAVQTLKGTRSLHVVKCVEANKLLTRKLSCSCAHCFSGIDGCSQEETVGQWVEETLRPARRPRLPAANTAPAGAPPTNTVPAGAPPTNTAPAGAPPTNTTSWCTPYQHCTSWCTPYQHCTSWCTPCQQCCTTCRQRSNHSAY